MRSHYLTIYKKDIKAIATNWVALVIMIGLSLLPSLYAWVNIGASWDPYSNTKGIKVAVVNEDRGGAIKGTSVNIGNEVKETLQKNDKLGWVFYNNKDDGIDAVQKGRVYATIIIPEDFSRDMCTVLDENPVKPKLEYYVNEKMNAIAPKMTDSGASTLQKQISSTFDDTAVKKAFEILNKLGGEINSNFPKIEEYKYKLFELDEKLPELSKRIDNISNSAQNDLIDLGKKTDDITEVQKTLELTMSYMDDINKDLLDTNDMVTQNTPQIKENLALMETILDNVTKITKESGDAITTNKPIMINDINNSLRDISELNVRLQNTADRVGNAGREFSNRITEADNDISATLVEYQGLLSKLRSNLINGNTDVQPILSALEALNSKLSDQMGVLNTEVNSMYTDLDNMLQEMQSVTKSISELSASNTLISSDDKSQQIENIIEQLQAIDNGAQYIPLFAGVVVINEQLINMLSQLEGSYQNLNDAQQLISDIAKKNADLSQSVANQRVSLSNFKSSLNSDLTLLQATFYRISGTCSDLKDMLAGSTDSIANEIDLTVARMAKLNSSLKEITDKLSASSVTDSADVRYQLLSVCPKLDELSKRLVQLREKLESNSNTESLLYDISDLTFNLETATKKLELKMDDSILPKIQKYLLNSASLMLQTRNLVNNTNNDLDILKDLLKRIQEKGQISVDEFNEIKAKLPVIQNDIHTLTTKIKDFESTSDIGDIEKILQRDANKEGDFFSSPVELDTHKIYHVASYGAAMTPFYSVLSLWVGALLLSALLSTKSKNAGIDFSPKEEFWGKYLVFLTFGLIQGFIVCMGDIFVLGVRPQESVLFVILGMFYSGVFVMIVYSLVALFGNVGKAIAVVFMVVQLAGSGGTFPIELLPAFFQRVYALLPFTYAISAMREAIAGVMYSVLVKDLAVLSGYFFLFMIFGLKSKKWVNMVTDKLSHKLAESGITGH